MNRRESMRELMNKRWLEKREEMIENCQRGGKARLGKKNPKLSEKMKGHKPTFSKETLGEERYNLINEQRKLKISKKMKEIITPEIIKGIHESRKKLPHYGYSEEKLKRMSERFKEMHKDGGLLEHPWNKGLTKFTNASVKNAADKRRKYPEKIDRKAYGWTLELRQKIRTRDNWTCQRCGKKQKEIKGVLNVHHIDEDPRNNFVDNLISLCHPCHCKVHNKSLLAARGF
jgi:5-methylcytosine-specific restriction endonuclease McrA